VVAVLLAGGVLLGFAALVIDVGLIYAEREELVTGADAAALAVGRACSNDRPECADEAAILNLVSNYANANASDGVSNVLEVCGQLPGRLTACTAAPNNLTRCLGGAPPDPTAYVEVRLSTQVGDGLVLPPAFAQTLTGNEGYDGTAVRACARVSWERIDVLGLTVSTCEFEDAPIPNGGPPYGADDEYVVQFLTGHHGGCAGAVGAGSWGHADHAGYLDANGACRTEVPEDAEMWGDEPISAPYEPSCPKAALDALIASGRPVWVPVHDAHRHVGPRTAYRVVSVAKFVVTGYYFGDDPDEQKKSVLSDALPCESSPSQDRSCISGVFVGPSQPVYSLAGDAIVRLVG
jgi:hypothetical protein